MVQRTKLIDMVLPWSMEMYTTLQPLKMVFYTLLQEMEKSIQETVSLEGYSHSMRKQAKKHGGATIFVQAPSPSRTIQSLLIKQSISSHSALQQGRPDGKYRTTCV
ncbi:hypothetical protein BG842_09675 [Haladaptatus sp. W1]|nr:hypothetical protein BG842_09675 [Haladaptatus sp. W1]